MTTLLYDIARCPGVPHEPGEPLVRQDVLTAEAKARKEGEKK